MKFLSLFPSLMLFLPMALSASLPGDLQWGGDLKLRAEFNDTPRPDDKERFRVRLRLNTRWDLSDAWQLASSIAATGTQRSPYQTIGNGDEEVNFHLNTAFLRHKVSGYQWFLGKFSNPNKSIIAKDMLFDGDVHPEGFAGSFSKGHFGGAIGYYGLNDREVVPRYRVFSAQVTGEFGSEKDWFFTASTYLLDQREATPAPEVDLGELSLAKKWDLASGHLNTAGQWFHNFSSDTGDDHGWVVSSDWKNSHDRFQLQYQHIETQALQPSLAQDDFLLPAGFKGWLANLSHQLKSSTQVSFYAMGAEPLDGRYGIDWRYRIDVDITF